MQLADGGGGGDLGRRGRSFENLRNKIKQWNKSGSKTNPRRQPRSGYKLNLQRDKMKKQHGENLRNDDDKVV